MRTKAFHLGRSQLLFGVCKEIPIRGFDLLLQSCTAQRQDGIFFFTKDERSQRDNFYVWSCHFASEHFGFDDMMTTMDLTGTSNGERSFTKSRDRKRALPFGISNSNLAGVLIGLQRSRKAKNKKKS